MPVNVRITCANQPGTPRATYVVNINAVEEVTPMTFTPPSDYPLILRVEFEGVLASNDDLDEVTPERHEDRVRFVRAQRAVLPFEEFEIIRIALGVTDDEVEV